MQLYIYVLCLSCLFIIERLKVNATSRINGHKYFLNVNHLKLPKRSSPSKSFHINTKNYETVSDKTNEFVNSDFLRNHQKYYFHNPGIHGVKPQFRNKYTVLLDINACPLGYIKVFQKFKYGHAFTFCQKSENVVFDFRNGLTDTMQEAARHFGSKHLDEADSSDLGKYSIKSRVNEILNSDKMMKRSGSRRLSIQGAMSSLAGMLRSSTSNRPAASPVTNKDSLKYKLFLIGK